MAFTLGVGSGQASSSPSTGGGGVSLIDVRVKDIVLSSNHPRFEEVGGWSGIGTIIFDSTEGRLASTRDTIAVAKPLFSNSKFLPLINEIVAVVSIVDPVESQQAGGDSKKLNFYFPPANVWNSQHHNALPDNKVSGPYQQGKSTEELRAGSPNYEPQEENPIFLGRTF